MPTVLLKPLSGMLRQITAEEAEKMLQAGTAFQPEPSIAKGIYFEKHAPPDLDSTLDEDPPGDDQTYQTRDMLAQPKKRRGRPPGSKNKPTESPAA